MPSRTCFGKPLYSTWSVYTPGGNAVSVKMPSSLDEVSRRTLVATFVAVTSAPAMTAPDGSVTDPVICPVGACAKADSARNRKANSRVAGFTPDAIDMDSTPQIRLFRERYHIAQRRVNTLYPRAAPQGRTRWRRRSVHSDLE